MRRCLAVIAIVFFLFVLCVLAARAVLQHPLSVPTQLTVQVKQRHTVRSIVKALSDEHALAYPRLTGYLLRVRYAHRVLRAGEYVVLPGDTVVSFMQRVLSGTVLRRHLLIVEGWTIQQVLAHLAADPTVTHTLTENPKHLLAALGLPAGPAEGLFFPDTYFYHRGVTDKRLLLLSYHTMQRVLTAAWKHHAAGLAYTTPYQALIVASLIEKETANPKERALVAAVINNRLRQHMRLQIDPSVVYGLGLPYGTVLTHAMMKQKTPYNTYRQAGLPPTPIALPSKASLEAACHPASSEALYYVAQPNGKHVFSKTYRHHLKGVGVLRAHQRRERQRASLSAAGHALLCVSSVLAEALLREQPNTVFGRVLCADKQVFSAAMWYHRGAH